MTKLSKKAFVELVQAINVIIEKYSSQPDVTVRSIDGLIILQFPKNHEENGLVHSTFLGKVCMKHAVECILETDVESMRDAIHSTLQDKNPLAS